MINPAGRHVERTWAGREEVRGPRRTEVRNTCRQLGLRLRSSPRSVSDHSLLFNKPYLCIFKIKIKKKKIETPYQVRAEVILLNALMSPVVNYVLGRFMRATKEGVLADSTHSLHIRLLLRHYTRIICCTTCIWRGKCVAVTRLSSLKPSFGKKTTQLHYCVRVVLMLLHCLDMCHSGIFSNCRNDNMSINWDYLYSTTTSSCGVEGAERSRVSSTEQVCAGGEWCGCIPLGSWRRNK